MPCKHRVHTQGQEGQWLKASMNQISAHVLRVLKLFLHPTAVTAFCREDERKRGKTLHRLMTPLGCAIHKKALGSEARVTQNCLESTKETRKDKAESRWRKCQKLKRRISIVRLRIGQFT